MAGPSLFAEGWRQGSLIRTPLDVRYYDVDDDNNLRPIDRSFDKWALATQDCDLDLTPSTNSTRQFELRPLFSAEGENVDGIRNRSALITDELVLKADGPKLTLTARALNKMKRYRDDSVPANRRREIKTWLGLRYDRPAVPVPFDRIAMQVLHPRLIGEMPVALAGQIRDILVYYVSETTIRLFAILREGGSRDACLKWLSSVSERLSADNGIVVVERHAEEASRTPFSVVESYYGLQAAELSLTGTN